MNTFVCPKQACGFYSKAGVQSQEERVVKYKQNVSNKLHLKIAFWVLLDRNKTHSLGPGGVYLALASIQCFILVSIAPESPDSKSARCEAATLGEIELFTF